MIFANFMETVRRIVSTVAGFAAVILQLRFGLPKRQLGSVAAQGLDLIASLKQPHQFPLVAMTAGGIVCRVMIMTHCTLNVTGICLVAIQIL